MKKFFYLALTSFFLCLNYSCGSDNIINNIDNESNTNNTEYEVSIKLASFTSEFEDLRSTNSDNGEVGIKHLFYQIDDTTNQVIVTARTLNSDTVMKILNIRLRKGNYRLKIFCSDQPISVEQIKLGGVTDSETDYVLNLDNLANGNIFHGSTDFSIENSNTAESILLTRPLGKISLAISDLNKMPADVKSITPILVRRTIYDNPAYNSEEGGYYLIPKYIELQSTYNYFLDRSAVDESMNPMKENIYQTITLNRDQFNLINENNSFNFYLPQTVKTRRNQSYSAGYEAAYDLYLIGSKTEKVQFAPIDRPEMEVKDLAFVKRIAKNISILPNKQIIIKGKFFGDDQVNVIINDAWGETIENEFN